MSEPARRSACDIGEAVALNRNEADRIIHAAMLEALCAVAELCIGILEIIDEAHPAYQEKTMALAMEASRQIKAATLLIPEA